ARVAADAVRVDIAPALAGGDEVEGSRREERLRELDARGRPDDARELRFRGVERRRRDRARTARVLLHDDGARVDALGRQRARRDERVARTEQEATEAERVDADVQERAAADRRRED